MNKKALGILPAFDARIYNDIKMILAEARQKAHRAQGFTEQNLRNFRQFYSTFPDNEQIRYALGSGLSWTHYRILMRIGE